METVPLVRYQEYLVDYDEVIPVVDTGAGQPKGYDVSHIDGGSAYRVETIPGFGATVGSSNSVLFSINAQNLENVRKYMSLVKGHAKQVFICDETDEQLDCDFDDCYHLTFNSESMIDVGSKDRLLKIPVPVILVFGHGQQCNKFDIQIGLRKKFQELGYKVSQVGTKKYSPLFGFHALPFYPNIPLWKKILIYNRYFRGIVKAESPDVLIVGVPGGITAINEWHSEYFGETAISVSKSLSPDVAIFSLYYGMLHSEYINNVINYSKYALDASPDYFHLSNSKLVFEEDMRSVSYLTTDSSKVLDGQEVTDSRLFNIFSQHSTETVFEQVVCQLQCNIESF